MNELNAGSGVIPAPSGDVRLATAPRKLLGERVVKPARRLQQIPHPPRRRDRFARMPVMYGRPPLGKENLAASAMGLEQSCIRPVCCGRLTAGPDGLRGLGSQHCGALGGAMTDRSVPTQVLTVLPSLLSAPCGCLARWPEGVMRWDRAED